MEFLNLWLTFPVAVVGIGYTIVQVGKTKSASEAARDSAQAAEGMLSKNQLILLIPILHRAESDLEHAIGVGERRLVAYHLSSWRWFGSQFRSYLSNMRIEDRELAVAMQNSIALAADAKLDVSDNASDLVAVCRPVLASIASVTGELGRIAAEETRKVVPDVRG